MAAPTATAAYLLDIGLLLTERLEGVQRACRGGGLRRADGHENGRSRACQ